ncbi:MAG: 50S ribosomal protein L11 methyltransferase [Alphaproteobacteria bacterium]|nr:50S ribosomal protein L11 methyltransferase [Alphaproteobacteria bacterium]
MSHNAGSCKIVKFKKNAAVSEQLQAFADEFFDVVAINYEDDGSEQMVGYMRENVADDALPLAAREAGIVLPEFAIEVISSQDWLTENVIEFAPVEVGPFLVYGVHEKEIGLHGKIGLQVYAATAFGSEHQTTIGCLEAMSDLFAQGYTVHSVLDVGTGTGILAIGAAKLWPESVAIAVDIDDQAVEAAKQNAVNNGVDAKIGLSDGYQSALVTENAPYDLILANILARPLISMASDLAHNLKKGGYAVISGFIEDQVDWVVKAHEEQGLKCKKIYARDGWRIALLEK